MGNQAGKDRTVGGGKEIYETDPDFFAAVNAEFNFGLDAAAEQHNSKCSSYIDKALDALAATVNWILYCVVGKSIWINPPYSRGMVPAFLQKAYETSQNGIDIVLLAHSCQDTKYWDDWVFGKAAEVRYIKGRLPFWGPEPDKKGKYCNISDLPHALIVYRKRWTGPTHQYSWDWKQAHRRFIGPIPKRDRKSKDKLIIGYEEIAA